MLGEVLVGGSDFHHCIGIKQGARKLDASEMLGCHPAAWYVLQETAAPISF